MKDQLPLYIDGNTLRINVVPLIGFAAMVYLLFHVATTPSPF